MSLSTCRTKPDRRAGAILITVLTLGILGATLAVITNGGHVPAQSASAAVHLAKLSAPL
jgi:hypothetical protein